MRGHRRKWLFLIDGNLPPSLGDVFRANGHEAVHVADLGMQRAADIEIWKHAHSNRAVIVTKDKDFASLAISRADVCPVILVRIGNVRRAALLAKFRNAMRDVLAALSKGELLIELA